MEINPGVLLDSGCLIPGQLSVKWLGHAKLPWRYMQKPHFRSGAVVLWAYNFSAQEIKTGTLWVQGEPVKATQWNPALGTNK